MMRRNRFGGRFLGIRRGQGNLPPRYSEANRRLDLGDYEGAATLLGRLARDSEMRHPRATSRLWLEAGQARLFAGQTAAALQSFRQGLDLLIEQQRWFALHRMGAQVVQSLRAHGAVQPADEIAAWLQKQPNAADDDVDFAPSADESVIKPAPRLPTRCPSCGGPLDPRDVVWVDENTAECDFCGSLVRAEA